MELQFHLAELVTLVGMAIAVIRAAFRVTRAADRVGNVLKDFPPHRHTPDGYIIYPDGYEPPKVQRAHGASQ